MRTESPIELALVAHAVAVAEIGPCAPYLMLICPAAMFTISYSWAVVVPVISGMAWDVSGVASSAFLPIALCGILLVILAPAINHVPRIGS